MEIDMTDVIIFSVYNHEIRTPIENRIFHYETMKALEFKGIKYKEVLGCYNHEIEYSLVVPNKSNTFDYLAFIIELTKDANQQSILLLGHKNKIGIRTATLFFLKDLSSFKLGFYREVSKEFALNQPGYTYDFSTNTYYTTFDNLKLACKGA